MQNSLTEKVKKFLNLGKGVKKSSEVSDENTLLDLDKDSSYPHTASFFDGQHQGNYLISKHSIEELVTKQERKIMKYRKLAMTPDVAEAIDEIVNEIIFSIDDQIPLQIEINEENDKLVEKITEKFNKILKLLNVRRNIFSIVKNGYIDGQLVIHTPYSVNEEEGIVSAKMIEPSRLFYDEKGEKYKYIKRDRSQAFYSDSTEVEYSVEEIAREDFGLHDDGVNLSYLEYAIKPANVLKTLEDLLIPMRFSRSISRRVFNVDIGDLPTKRGEELMKENQRKFKYKKFYNSETGEVTNQQHITSMVEDYWFGNRSGGKGTTVDVLDESGNLGELGDILYFAKKLYKSLKIPSNRIDINTEADDGFEYDASRVTKQDLTFFMFISRIRQVYSSLFKEILRREVVRTGVMKDSEWNEKENLINITFVNENKFIERMKLQNFTEQMDIYSNSQEHAGKLISYRRLLKDIFRWSDDEIDEESKKIAKEEKDSKMARFYKIEEDEY